MGFDLLGILPGMYLTAEPLHCPIRALESILFHANHLACKSSTVGLPPAFGYLWK